MHVRPDGARRGGARDSDCVPAMSAGAAVAEVVLRGEQARLRATAATAVLVLCILGSIAAAIGSAHVLVEVGLGPAPAPAPAAAPPLQRLPADALWYPFVPVSSSSSH